MTDSGNRPSGALNTGTGWQKAMAFVFGLASPVFVVILALETTQLWPLVSASAPAAGEPAVSKTVRFGLSIDWTLEQSQGLLLLSVIAGLMGGLMYSMARYARLRASGRFHGKDASFYWTRSVIGAGLGLVVYAATRGGVLVLGGGDDNSDQPNPYAVFAIAAVTGLFTDKALNKLRQFAGDHFSTADGENDPALCAITSVVPARLAAGAQGAPLTLLLSSPPPDGTTVAVDKVATTASPGAQPTQLVISVTTTSEATEVLVALMPPGQATSVVTVPVGNA
jgi:hypothetical protein